MKHDPENLEAEGSIRGPRWKAWLDHELDAEARARFEAQLERDPELRRTVSEARKISASLREALAPTPRLESAKIRGWIGSGAGAGPRPMTGRSAGREPFLRRTRRARLFAAAAALLLAGGLAIYLARRGPEEPADGVGVGGLSGTDAPDGARRRSDGLGGPKGPRGPALEDLVPDGAEDPARDPETPAEQPESTQPESAGAD